MRGYLLFVLLVLGAAQACKEEAAGGCPPNLSICGDYCTELAVDPQNCGACGKTCPTGQTCQTGGCIGIKCSAGSTLCGGTCVDLDFDEKNCGKCGNVCPPVGNFPPSCFSGSCQE